MDARAEIDIARQMIKNFEIEYEARLPEMDIIQVIWYGNKIEKLYEDLDELEKHLSS